MAKADLTPERLRALLEYCPDTGEFLWRETGKGRRPDRKAGSASERGYVFICIDNHIWRAHRLAWLYVHGRLPEHQIDHINGDRSDNRIANLRDVTGQANSQNQRKAYARSVSGLRGVTWRANRGHWVATINYNGRIVYLGSFATPDEAHAAYVEARPIFHPGFPR